MLSDACVQRNGDYFGTGDVGWWRDRVLHLADHRRQLANPACERGDGLAGSRGFIPGASGKAPGSLGATPGAPAATIRKEELKMVRWTADEDAELTRLARSGL